ncbi:7-carboxy-7-deazaguanine synthase [Pelagibaculum spongiae]|uniref:7-carboxy-7-deazaguanine synthase n=1 Tax=Pelagibaculum spongiae TaxID=2080658 RepID=A0A2V1GNL2_9GAMM|nr:7-carboxy-7-deazaguanine synthase [Pelagibaculum spongiae]PVZ63433.1 7-carboxy-7-deazaguanine synthase [Pelagibaculum spongiae]
MSYSVKEVFYTLQGEGAMTGRASVFCRFSGCNLWSGLEKHRAESPCHFCDTDFRGTDGPGGGKFTAAKTLANHIASFWPENAANTGNSQKPYVVITGGEPLLQLDQALVDALHQVGFEIGIETNGTQPAPSGIDWLCLSPKTKDIVLEYCDELKLVYPLQNIKPEDFANFPAKIYYLTPMADPKAADNNSTLYQDQITRQTIDYCHSHPQWRLNLQSHKLVNIP